MILTEFDEEDYREFLREEARERGLAEGIQAFISVCQDFHLAYEDTLKKLTENFPSLPKKLLPIWNNIGNKMKMSSN